MKDISNNENLMNDELLPEYNFDYSKGIKNPFFKKNRVFIEIDEEILEVFQNQNNINAILLTIANSINQSKLATN
jgi:hypothetical protein